MKVIIGQSEYVEAKDAAEDVVQQCLEKLQGKKPKLGILFSNAQYDHKIILEKINSTFPDIILIGGSSVSELSSVQGFCEGSVVLALFCMDKINVYGTVIRDVSKNNFETSYQKALEDLPSGVLEKAVCCITVPDSLDMTVERIVGNFKKRLGTNFPVLGGASSDSFKFNVFQFYNNEILKSAAPMVFFTGPLELSYSAASGWLPLSPLKPLSKSEVNVALEIDQSKALDFYEHYLKSRKPTMAHPLAVYEPGQKEFYLRGPLKENDSDGSVAFCCAFPEPGSQVCIASSTPEKILNEQDATVV